MRDISEDAAPSDDDQAYEDDADLELGDDEYMPQKPSDWDDEEDGVWEPPDEARVELVRKEFDEQNDKLTKLQSEQTKLEKKLANDYGPEQAFLSVLFPECYLNVPYMFTKCSLNVT